MKKKITEEQINKILEIIYIENIKIQGYKIIEQLLLSLPEEKKDE